MEVCDSGVTFGLGVMGFTVNLYHFPHRRSAVGPLSKKPQPHDRVSGHVGRKGFSNKPFPTRRYPACKQIHGPTPI